MIQFVQKSRIGVFSLVFMLAMAIPRLASAQTAAVLVKTFDISAAGPGPRMRIGDMNGDGRLDFLLCDATDETPSQVAMLTAYDGVTGTKMWQVGSGGSAGTDRDEPCQIYDIDNDGNNEVVAVIGGQMGFYNGADGKLKTSFPIPAASAHDAIMFANFSGNPVPQDIVVKDRYTQAWAMDVTGKLLWTYQGITGHYNVPFDVDGDGRDEFFTGYSQLDYQGKPKYTAPINYDHPDNIWIGDIDGDPTNGYEVAYGLAQQPSCQMVSTRTGKVMWTNSDMTETQQLLLADYLPDSKGLELFGLDRTVRSSLDSLFLIDSTGKTLWKETGTNGSGGTAVKPILNWDGTNKPMVLVFKRGTATVWDGGTHTMQYKLGMDGNAVMGDLAGDSKTEILMYSKTTANVYAIAQLDWNTPAANPGHPQKQTRQQYNWSRYGSSDIFALTAVADGPTGPPGGGTGAGGATGTGGAAGTGGTTGSTAGTTGSPGGTTGSPGGTTGSPGGTTGSTGGRGGRGGTTGGGGGTSGTTTTGGTLSINGGSTAGGGVGGGSTATGGTIVATGGGTASTGGVLGTGGAGTGGSPNVTGGAAAGGTSSSGGAVRTGGIAASGGTSGTPIAGAGGSKATGNSGGCSCRVAGQPSQPTMLASLGFLGLMMLRSLRRRRSH
jgi:MYXO-CTERM domain-containing protein